MLELTVVGIPELSQRVPVEINGETAFPLIGELKIEGISISEVRERVKASLSSIVYRGQGRADNPEVIRKQDVSLRVAVYRPVHVSGDVARPGEIPFRPGMTVRQAVSAAGGYDPLRLGARSLILGRPIRNSVLRRRHTIEKIRLWASVE